MLGNLQNNAVLVMAKGIRCSCQRNLMALGPKIGKPHHEQGGSEGG